MTAKKTPAKKKAAQKELTAEQHNKKKEKPKVPEYPGEPTLAELEALERANAEMNREMMEATSTLDPTEPLTAKPSQPQSTPVKPSSAISSPTSAQPETPRPTPRPIPRKRGPKPGSKNKRPTSSIGSGDGLLQPIDIGDLNKPEAWRDILLTSNIVLSRADIMPITEQEAELFGRACTPVVRKYSVDFEYKEELLLAGAILAIALPRVLLAVAKRKKPKPIDGTAQFQREFQQQQQTAPKPAPRPAPKKKSPLPHSYHGDGGGDSGMTTPLPRSYG